MTILCFIHYNKEETFLRLIVKKSNLTVKKKTKNCDIIRKFLP